MGYSAMILMGYQHLRDYRSRELLEGAVVSTYEVYSTLYLPRSFLVLSLAIR
jgi:hypothetical protein